MRNKWFLIALGLVFVLSCAVGIFGLGKVIKQGLLVSLDLLPCDYIYMEQPLPKGEYYSPECKPNKQRPMEELTEGVSMIIPSLPIAVLAYRVLRKENEETK